MQVHICPLAVRIILPSCKLVHLAKFSLCLLVLCADSDVFTNSLDPDQARQNVGPDLDPNCLTF